MNKIFNKIALIVVLSLYAHNTTLAKNIKLIPGTKEYENYMNNSDLEESIHNQRSWMLSAIFPGAGQLYNDKKLRALSYMTAIIGLAGGALYCNIQYTKYKHQEFDASDYSSYADVRDGLILGAFLVYVINIFDAYVGAKLTKFELSKDVSVQIVPDITENRQPALSMNMNFI